MRLALRDWVTNGTPPPAERLAAHAWPEERAATWSRRRKQAMGFPSGVPGIPDSIFAPENFIFPIFDYDWGPQFDEFNATGVPTNSRRRSRR